MVEVHTGAKPGRPQLLLVFSAALLMTMLGLAWLQAHQTRALGPEQAVPGTPLRVRLPQTWQPDPADPQSFLLPCKSAARREAVGFERRLRFEFVELGTYQPLDALLRAMHLTTATRASPPRATRIGPYPAVEVRKIESRRLSNRQTLRRERIVRFTCLPGGQLIKITYEPLLAVRPADFEILDDVCDTLHLEGPALGRRPEEYLVAAGLRFPLRQDWTITGPAIAEVPGLYLGGTENGAPAWSLGVFRTWLAAGRQPRDLLADLAAEQWLLLDADAHIETSQRADGAWIASVRHPRFGVTDERLASAWVVAVSEDRAAILLVRAGPKEAAAADDMARRLASVIEFEPLAVFSSMAAAERAGKRLVDELHRNGPKPRWGSARADASYVGRSPASSSWLTVSREARHHDPQQGYEGVQMLWSGAPAGTASRDLKRWAQRRPVSRTSSWNLSARASTYEWTHSRLDEPPPLTIVEHRQQGDGTVVREIEFEGRRAFHRTYRPGAGFAPPPVEEVITGWVAREEAEMAVIEVSSLLGASTHTLFLRALPPDGDYPRVLIQQDYWPLGAIQAWDDDQAETVYETYPYVRFERVPDAP